MYSALAKSFPLNYLSFMINSNEIVLLISHKSFPPFFFLFLRYAKTAVMEFEALDHTNLREKQKKDIEIHRQCTVELYFEIIGVCKLNDMLLPSVLSPMQRNKIALYLSLGLGNFLASAEHLGQFKSQSFYRKGCLQWIYL